MVDEAKVVCYIFEYVDCCLPNPHLLNREKHRLPSNHARSQIHRLPHHHDLQKATKALPRFQQEVRPRSDNQLHLDRRQQAPVAFHRLTTSHHSSWHFHIRNNLPIFSPGLVLHLWIFRDCNWYVYKLRCRQENGSFAKGLHEGIRCKDEFD